MLMRDIRLCNYSHFNTGNERKDKNLMNAFKYIDSLASDVGHDITKWNVLEVFKNPNDLPYIHTDKKKINMIFFNTQREEIRTKPKQDVDIPDSVKTFLSNMFTDSRQDAIRRAQRDVNSAICNLNRWTDEYTNRIIRVNKAKDNLRRIQGLKDNVAELLESAMKNPFFIFSEMDEEYRCIKFLTPPITLRYKNAKEKVDLTVPMGVFKICLWLESLHMTVDTHEDNLITPQGYYHPHVSSNGHICYGNARQALSRAVEAGDLEYIFEITAHCLQNYSDDNPHAHLYKFNKINEENIRLRKIKQTIKDGGDGINDSDEEDDLDDNIF